MKRSKTMNHPHLLTAFLFISLLLSADVHAADQSTLSLIHVSATISQILDVNDQGMAIGERDIPTDTGFDLLPFYYHAGEFQTLLPPNGYTSVNIFRISNNGWAAGFATRDLGNPNGNLVACVWNPSRKELITLPKVDGFLGSAAFDISANGERVCGYINGRDPARMQPCVWEKKDEQWIATPLPSIHPLNTYLSSSKVVISDDGKRIAACLATKLVETEVSNHRIAMPQKNHLFQWEQDENSQWKRSELSQQGVVLANINNRGTVVGYRVQSGTRHPFVLEPGQPLTLLDTLPGDASAEASDVNNDDVVVGSSDDPRGPDGGSSAFVWKSGRVTKLEFPLAPLFSNATSITDRGIIAGAFTAQATAETAESNYAFVLTPIVEAKGR